MAAALALPLLRQLAMPAKPYVSKVSPFLASALFGSGARRRKRMAGSLAVGQQWPIAKRLAQRRMGGAARRKGGLVNPAGRGKRSMRSMRKRVGKGLVRQHKVRSHIRRTGKGLTIVKPHKRGGNVIDDVREYVKIYGPRALALL